MYNTKLYNSETDKSVINSYDVISEIPAIDSSDNISVFKPSSFLKSEDTKNSNEQMTLNEQVSDLMVKQNPKISKEIEAKIKGYEGEACGECGNFTLVRNGTCMKCNTCGATSGCS